MILIPFKPAVLVLGLLSGLVFAGFIGSSLLEGKAPFKMERDKARQTLVRQVAPQATPESVRLHKVPSARAR
jgi:hypothetical protein